MTSLQLGVPVSFGIYLDLFKRFILRPWLLVVQDLAEDADDKQDDDRPKANA